MDIIFQDYEIVIHNDEDYLIETKPRININYNSNRCISFYELNDKILTDGIDRCSDKISTKDTINKLIEYAKFKNIKKIEIGSDGSRLIFKSNKKEVEIYLKYIFLLKYGYTYYNSLGFGTQDIEWQEFINKKIRDTKLREIEQLNDVLDMKIKDYFTFLHDYLKNVSTKSKYNIVDDYHIEIISDISKLFNTIFKRNKNELIYVPKINNDKTMYL